MRALRRDVAIFGNSFPIVAVGLAVVTLVVTVLAANVRGVAAYAVLVPDLVFHGQIWRLVTWTFLEPSPLGLIFVCFAFLFFGRELAYRWGPVGFLQVCFGIVVGSGLMSCLLWLVARRFWQYEWTPWGSAWALGEALIIAYAMLFPSRTILVYFVLPLAGRQLLILTVATTVLFALLTSVVYFIPHFAAQALMYAFIRGYSPLALFRRLRTAGPSLRKRSGHLRAVDREEEPPRWVH